MEDRRRFAHASHDMTDSVRSSFEHSLTSINEDMELTGEQLEMLELGSRIQRTKKSRATATAASSSS
eukprot:CAMPEP_0198141728 /NCGR_PEP_ID=MMETSP1443-20131203/4677_1 /TAXON_ID=186043 /ORGANISM="Entomoneis sp., Strain CCMP2396" /LENGTH=66 /DNA_ID=CAMNT_0043804551 /DNA_START=122 /DNA_END=318 /DNA_ORIENTATION=-